MLLKKRIEVRRQVVAALVAVDGGLKGADKDRLLHTTIVPVLVARGQNREVATANMMIRLPSMRQNCRLERGSAGNSSR